ncbi:MAG: methyl-accepting chemotaxis protein [Pseudomonadota bacterium]
MFSHLTLKAKTLAAFALIALVAFASGAMSVWRTVEIETRIEEGQNLRAYNQSLQAVRARVAEQDIHLKRFILTGDRAYLSQMQKDAEAVAALADETLANVQEPGERAALEEAIGEWRAWNERHVARVVADMRKPETIDLARLEESAGEHLVHLAAFEERSAEIQTRLFKRLSDAAAADRTAATSARVGALIGAGIVVGLAVLLGAALYRLMSHIASTMRAMEAGEVEAMTADAERRDEIGAMARAANAFREKLADIERSEAAREEQQRQTAEERAAMMARLRDGFGVVVAAAVDGDFTKRVDADFDDETLNQLAHGLNALLDAVHRGVDETTRVTARLADGDLTNGMQGEFRGAFAELQSSLNAALRRFDALVGEIMDGAEATRGSAAEIQTNADDLARRAESQASSLEETAATMEEMTATIRENAQSAERAQQLATDAAGSARQGGAVVQEAVEAIDQIERSSSKIADIISVIDGIAFQTNLLALNAAVEAARAGDAGKGFAVVASEVRELAQRSATAAKDISALIEESSSNVSSGVDRVKRTGDALTQLVGAVDTVATVVAEISSANREQSSGVEEISKAVSHMDQLTQQNSAMAEQSAGAARSLADNSVRLAEKVSFFKTNARSPAPAHASPSSAPAAFAPSAPSAPLDRAANESWAEF